MRKDGITRAQAIDLVEIGIPKDGKILMSTPIDVIFDWIRKEHNIHVYNTFAPFVDPVAAENNKDQILYGFGIKKCNYMRGWNGREQIGNVTHSNIYVAKRMCLNIIIKYLKSTRINVKNRK